MVVNHVVPDHGDKNVNNAEDVVSEQMRVLSTTN
jgi:hypothetical protein